MNYAKFLSYYLLNMYLSLGNLRKKKKKLVKNLKMPRTVFTLSQLFLCLVCTNKIRLHYWNQVQTRDRARIWTQALSKEGMAGSVNLQALNSAV